MTLLHEILDVEELEQLMNDGYVRRQTHPDNDDYGIFNYTKKAVGIEWTPTLRECRGLIVDNIKVIARPFAKFFNSDEPQSSWINDVSPDASTIAMDKMDGSLGIMYMAPDGLPAIATRGSFASDQAIHGTKVLREKYLDWAIERFSINDSLTHLFEIIYPENRIVLDYKGLDDLVYLGFRAIDDGMVFWPSWEDFPGPISEIYSDRTLADALSLAIADDKEGLVLYVNVGPGDWRMCKVKSDSYKALHRIVTGLNERTVWQSLVDGTTKEILESLPAEHAEWARSIGFGLAVKASKLVSQVAYQKRVLEVKLGSSDFKNNRKNFALEIVKSDLRAPLFMAFENKDQAVIDWALQQIKPEARKPTYLVEEEE